MKNKYEVLILIFFIIHLASKSALGQAEWHVSVPESVAISLNGLKQSSKELTERNHWLISEINVLEKKIVNFQNNIENINQKSEWGVTQPSKQTYGEISIRENKKIPSELQNGDFSGNKTEDDLLKKIALAQEEIQQMNQLISQETLKSVQIGDQESFDADLNVHQNNVKDLKRRIQAFDKEYSKSLDLYSSSKEKNNLLKEKYTLLTDQYKKAVAQEKQILNELKDEENHNAKLIKDFHLEISELRTEGSNLDKILSRASQKIKEKNTAFNIPDEEIELLMENLQFIKNENTVLKEKFNRTQEDLKNLGPSAQNN